MKTSVMVLLATLVLVTYSAGQEPKALDKQTPTSDAKMHTVTGSKPNTVVLEPKALPPMNPPLGDIARQARAAHAAAQKAEVVVDTDATETDGAKTETSKTDTSKTDASTNDTATNDTAPQK